MMQDYQAQLESILDSLGRIRQAMNRQSRSLDASIHLTAPQLVCMRQLQVAGPMTLGALARRVHTSPASLTGLVDRLERKDMVQRRRDEVDRRKVLVEMTKSGADVLAMAPWTVQDRLGLSLAQMPPEKRDELERAVGQLAEMMESPPPDTGEERHKSVS
ncbi:MarR family winged helix-turn-helix transcriptional regulator [Desulfohalovibrio reitneri]|uniref:MarR family winged helix-turn-helix transcriptional regulator n=1 Tax=Desulfohalovibrio reitneri TaxID=1307759 RepID=UPI0004A6C21A|nr:MarR family transcriptional regulator [Desulfohalovibrio reitneri]